LAGRQRGRQVGRIAERRKAGSGKKSGRQLLAERLACTQTGRQAECQLGKQADRQRGRQIEVGWQRCRQAGREASKQAEWQAGRRIGRQRQ
jgi:hypothetical protein